MLDAVLLLSEQCAPSVAPATMAALVDTESSFNPYAIGVVDGVLARQPRNLTEALTTAYALESADWNFSIGLAQINLKNLQRFDITIEQAFDPCTNLRVGGDILTECFVAHADSTTDHQAALQGALSCYYSGNYNRGFVVESNGTSYVQRIMNKAALINHGM